MKLNIIFISCNMHGQCPKQFQLALCSKTSYFEIHAALKRRILKFDLDIELTLANAAHMQEQSEF